MCPYGIERASSLWRTYNDTGEPRIDRTAQRALMTVTGYPKFPDAALEESAGYVEGVVLMCGARTVEVKTLRPGPDEFAFDVTWST